MQMLAVELMKRYVYPTLYLGTKASPAAGLPILVSTFDVALVHNEPHAAEKVSRKHNFAEELYQPQYRRVEMP